MPTLGGFSEELRLQVCWAAWWDEVTPNVLSPTFFHFPAQKPSGAQQGTSGAFSFSKQSR